MKNRTSKSMNFSWEVSFKAISEIYRFPSVDIYVLALREVSPKESSRIWYNAHVTSVFHEYRETFDFAIKS